MSDVLDGEYGMGLRGEGRGGGFMDTEGTKGVCGIVCFVWFCFVWCFGWVGVCLLLERMGGWMDGWVD